MLTRWVREAGAGGTQAFSGGGTPRDEELAETINGLYKAKVIHRRSRRRLEAVERAALDWVDWFGHKRKPAQFAIFHPRKPKRFNIGNRSR